MKAPHNRRAFLKTSLGATLTASLSCTGSTLPPVGARDPDLKLSQLELIPVRSTREMGRQGPSDPEKAVSEHVIVRLQTNQGITGLGEMSDVAWALSTESLGQLKTRLDAILMGQSPFDLTAIDLQLEEEDWQHQVECGIETALHDIVGKALDVPLYQLLGGKVRSEIPIAYPLAPCRNPKDVEANLERMDKLLGEETSHHPLLLRSRPRHG